MHPVITAWHKVQEVRSLNNARYLGTIQEALLEYNDLVASVSIPKFLVGFYMGANCQVYMIWLWDINHDYAANYWVEDSSCAASSI